MKLFVRILWLASVLVAMVLAAEALDGCLVMQFGLSERTGGAMGFVMGLLVYRVFRALVRLSSEVR
jgi:hypothetical protein